MLPLKCLIVQIPYILKIFVYILELRVKVVICASKNPEVVVTSTLSQFCLVQKKPVCFMCQLRGTIKCTKQRGKRE